MTGHQTTKPRPAAIAVGFATALAIASFFASFLTAAPAAAAAAKRIGVPKFDGAQEALVRKAVMQVIKGHGYELAKSREMDAAVQNTGALLESDDGFQKVAKELALTAIVTGEVGKKRAKIVIHDGREGSVLGEASFPGANPKKIAGEVMRNFWSQLGADLARGHTPSGSKKPQKVVAEAPEDDENATDAEGGGGAAPMAPEPRSSKKKTEVAEEAPAEDSHASEGSDGGDETTVVRKKKKKKHTEDSDEEGPGFVPPLLDVAAGVVPLFRGYAYHQDISGLRSYSLPGGPAVGLHVVAYPLAAVTEGPITNLGAVIGVEQGFAIASNIGSGDDTFAQGATFGTVVHEFSGGVRYRIPFGAVGHQVWFSGTGGEHAFVFTDRKKYEAMTPPMVLDIPDVIYQYIRPGVGARFELGDFAISADLGYRLIINGGGPQFKQFFPHATVAGIDASAYGAWRFMENVEARVGIDLRRYFSDMHSVAADARKAGGAVDQYLSVFVGAAFTFGGSDRSSIPDEEEAPAPKKKKKKKRPVEDEGGEDAGGGGGDAP